MSCTAPHVVRRNDGGSHWCEGCGQELPTYKFYKRHRGYGSAPYCKRCEDSAFERGLLWCVHCNQLLPADRFYLRTGARYGYMHHCKDCEKKRYEKCNGKESLRRSHAKKKAEIVRLAGGKCQRCGYDEFREGLMFHHINPAEKDVMQFANVGFERMHQEVDKCILLCLNCHSALHGGAWSARFIKRDGLGWTIAEGQV